jgi:homoserine dehydrogenase
MPKTGQINIALLGCGKLGQGIYKLWSNRRDKIKEQTGLDLNIKHILVKHLYYERDRTIPMAKITDDPEEILNDPSIKIVIDAIGGIEPTYSLIKKFLDRGLHLVSANRAMLASKLREIFELARSKRAHLQFDAALGGGIPIIHTMRRDLITARIRSVWGIASGSSNYILSEMHRSKKSLKQILQLPELQRLSESQMLIDFEGSDSAQKLALLAAMTFGVEVNYIQVYAEGLSNIKKIDIQNAEEFGYRIKQLAVLKDRSDGLELRVHPTLVPVDHPLVSVKHDYNAVYVSTDIVGEFMIYGKGAGIYPAASMVIRDLVEVGTTIKVAAKYMYEFPLWNEKPVLPINEIESKYYLRFPCHDMPGVMGKLATILGKNKINIESAHASVKTNKSDRKISYVHFFTALGREKQIQDSVAEINKLNVISGEIQLFRILGENSND